MSLTVVWVCRHIQSQVSKSLCLAILDEVVGRTAYRGCIHRPRKASTKRGNYPRTTFHLGPPPPQVHPSMDVQLTTPEMEHFGVGPVGEHGPLEAVSLSRERLGCEPVADPTLAIIVSAVVFRTVAALLEAVVQI